jgi:hypothetical protein
MIQTHNAVRPTAIRVKNARDTGAFSDWGWVHSVIQIDANMTQANPQMLAIKIKKPSFI